MAFVSQADRGLNALSKSLDFIGPGAYDVSHIEHTVGHSCAPFWSTAAKGMAKIEEGPGPGSYSQPHSNWHHTLTTYSNNNNVIIKLNSLGTSSFQSKIPRFAEDTQNIPGPGDYSVLQTMSSHNSQPRQRVKSNNLIKAASNAPSIPHINYLSQRRAKTEQKRQKSSDLVTKKGVLVGVWGKDKCRRFQNKRLEGLGPGTYNLFPDKPQPKTKTKSRTVLGSNSFVSNTVRTFDNIVYDAKNMQTLMLRQLQGYHAEKPAPGSYNITPASKASDIWKYRNQTFGSTRQRFQRSKTEETRPFYQIDHAFQHQSFLKKSVPFNSQSKKMSSEPTVDTIPGPGYYTIDHSGHRNNLLYHRSIQSFGTTAKRSLQPKRGSETLGPGCYEPNFIRAPETHESSVFASKLARPFQMDPKPDKKFASYDVGKGDISHKTMQAKIHRINLQKVNCSKPAFDHLTPRFKHYQQGERREKLTSQQVEYLMQQQREEERQRGISQARQQAKVKVGTMGREDRFKEGRKGPGVGDYALRSHWTKKSYNIKYSVEQ